MAKIEIDESDLRAMIEQGERDRETIKQKEQDIITMYKSVAGILHVIGLSDGKKIDPLVFNSEGIYTKIAKGGGSLITLMMQSKVPGFRKQTQKEIDEKFHFLKEMVPVLNEYNYLFDTGQLSLDAPAVIRKIDQDTHIDPVLINALKPAEPLQLKSPQSLNP